MGDAVALALRFAEEAGAAARSSEQNAVLLRTAAETAAEWARAAGQTGRAAREIASAAAAAARAPSDAFPANAQAARSGTAEFPLPLISPQVGVTPLESATAPQLAAPFPASPQQCVAPPPALAWAASSGSLAAGASDDERPPLMNPVRRQVRFSSKGAAEWPAFQTLRPTDHLPAAGQSPAPAQTPERAAQDVLPVQSRLPPESARPAESLAPEVQREVPEPLQLGTVRPASPEDWRPANAATEDLAPVDNSAPAPPSAPFDAPRVDLRDAVLELLQNRSPECASGSRSVRTHWRR